MNRSPFQETSQRIHDMQRALQGSLQASSIDPLRRAHYAGRVTQIAALLGRADPDGALRKQAESARQELLSGGAPAFTVVADWLERTVPQESETELLQFLVQIAVDIARNSEVAREELLRRYVVTQGGELYTQIFIALPARQRTNAMLDVATQEALERFFRPQPHNPAHQELLREIQEIGRLRLDHGAQFHRVLGLLDASSSLTDDQRYGRVLGALNTTWEQMLDGQTVPRTIFSEEYAKANPTTTPLQFVQSLQRDLSSASADAQDRALEQLRIVIPSSEHQILCIGMAYTDTGFVGRLLQNRIAYCVRNGRCESVQLPQQFDTATSMLLLLQQGHDDTSEEAVGILERSLGDVHHTLQSRSEEFLLQTSEHVDHIIERWNRAGQTTEQYARIAQILLVTERGPAALLASLSNGSAQQKEAIVAALQRIDGETLRIESLQGLLSLLIYCVQSEHAPTRTAGLRALVVLQRFHAESIHELSAGQPLADALRSIVENVESPADREFARSVLEGGIERYDLDRLIAVIQDPSLPVAERIRAITILARYTRFDEELIRDPLREEQLRRILQGLAGATQDVDGGIRQAARQAYIDIMRFLLRRMENRESERMQNILHTLLTDVSRFQSTLAPTDAPVSSYLARASESQTTNAIIGPFIGLEPFQNASDRPDNIVHALEIGTRTIDTLPFSNADFLAEFPLIVSERLRSLWRQIREPEAGVSEQTIVDRRRVFAAMRTYIQASLGVLRNSQIEDTAGFLGTAIATLETALWDTQMPQVRLPFQG